jgi:Alpha/beta hydrolase domain
MSASAKRSRYACTKRSLVGSICGLVFGALTSLAMAVPTPEVTGPVPSDPPGSPGRNYLFFATDLDLAHRGYVEEEFFYAGTANWYQTTGEPATATIVSSGHPYKTRLTVRRPANPARFNGIVIAEWTNVTSSYDNPAFWLRSHEFLMREGYAWVGIAAQRLAIAGVPDGLRNWSPVRYGTLDVADDALSYDVFAQGIQAVQAVPAVMGGLPVRHVIAAGISQSASRLAIYLNAVYPLDPISDGALVIIGGQQIRPDLDIPVMKVLSETEFLGAQARNRQADTDRFRTWWVTGTSHSEHHGGLTRNALFRRDLPDRPLFDTCTLPSRSRIHWHYAQSAAVDAIVKWVEQGVPPAYSPLPEWTSIDPTVVLARDAYGNALGGMRLASLAVPIATSQGLNSGPELCFLTGVHIPFDTATLASLYPSHEAYVRAVREAAEQNVRDGFLLKEDALELIRDAQSSLVGTGLICGPLCVNFKQFLSNPSTSNLRDQTQVYYFRGGKQLLTTLDQATRLVAEGYTAAEQADPATQKEKFQKAIKSLQRYIKDVEKMPRQERAAQETVDLLVDFANILIESIAAEAE